jgi:thiamine-monophosphate kinase
VSGSLGDARLALDALQGKLTLPAELLAAARQRLEQPTPRVALGLALRGVASAAIDVSDGLLGDLQHILESAAVGATVEVDIATSLVASSAYSISATSQFDINLTAQQWRTLALAGGDDYELLFTAAPAQRTAVATAARNSQTTVTRIGQMESAAGLRLIDQHGQPLPNTFSGFDHFAGAGK